MAGKPPRPPAGGAGGAGGAGWAARMKSTAYTIWVEPWKDLAEDAKESEVRETAGDLPLPPLARVDGR